MVWRNDQVTEEETNRIIKTLTESLAISGDVVEFGCYKGDTSLLLADVIKVTSKRLWIYDSFEGLPKKSPADMSVLGEDFKEGELVVTKREVKQRFLRSGLTVPIIKKSWFADLVDEDLPDKICFAFVDGDFYQSIADSLRLIETKMEKGGVILVHDYNNEALPGVAKAVDEWRKHKNIKFEVYRSLGSIIML